MTRSEVAKLVAMLLHAYPQAQFGDSSSRLYETLLADIDADMGLQAVQRLIATSRFLPTVAEIRSMAADIQHGPQRLGAEGWGDVVDAIRHVGSYQPPPKFADPKVTECVRLLGWLNLCRGENGAADRARFIELYDGLQTRARTDLVAGRALPSPQAMPALPRVTRSLPEPPAPAKAVTVAELEEKLAQAGGRA